MEIMNKYLLKVSVFIGRNDGKQLERTGRRNSKSNDKFTGKFVKSLLIDANPSLKKFFEKVSGCIPKLIHVTPLYVESGKIRCVHSLDGVNGDGKYVFYVGFIESGTVESPRSTVSTML